MNLLNYVPRLMMASLFLLSALSKAMAPAAMEGYMTAFGVPPILLWPTVLFELAVAVALVTGIQQRLMLWAAALWCLLTAAIFHHAWSDPIQFTHFLKNVTMAGAFLGYASVGLPRVTSATK